MSKAPENTESNYVIFPFGLATGAGFVHSRCYKDFLPSLRLELALFGLKWFRMCHLNCEEWMKAYILSMKEKNPTT